MKRVLLVLFLLISSSSFATVNSHGFLFSFIDSQTQRPIPLVTIEMRNGLKFVSDNGGNIFIDSPELIGKKVYFLVYSHGYELPEKNLFNEHGIISQLIPGCHQSVSMTRTNIAERLYRITGTGLYHHTQKAGLTNPATDLIESSVLGQDSTVACKVGNKIYWMWGDTLGYVGFNFGACSGWTTTENLDLEKGYKINYFTDKNGFSKPMIPYKSGLRWAEGILPFKVPGKKDYQIAAKYVVHETLEKVKEHGFAVFDSKKQQYRIIKRFKNQAYHHNAHPVPLKVNKEDWYSWQPWQIFKATLTDFVSSKRQWSFTCIKKDADKTKLKSEDFIRNSNGQLVFSWQKNGIPYQPKLQMKLHKRGLITDADYWLRPRDVLTGIPLDAFNGSICWNDHLKKWVMINQGKLGDIWFSIAPSFTGPWMYGKRIISHQKYNFYNPVHHSFLDQRSGKDIFIEGTYTNYFSGNSERTPRYDYNQIMYKLNLENPELEMPVPVFGNDSYLTTNLHDLKAANYRIVFYALSPRSKFPNTISIYRIKKSEGIYNYSAKASDNGILCFKLLANSNKNRKTEIAVMIEKAKIKCKAGLSNNTVGYGWKNYQNFLAIDNLITSRKWPE